MLDVIFSPIQTVLICFDINLELNGQSLSVKKKKKKKKKEKIIKNNFKKLNKFFYFQTKNRVQKMKLKMYIGPLLPKSQPRPNFQKIFVDPLTNIRRP